ncbi:MAG: hypothetical protein M1830_002967 [Pleopsidium flavum]|nr:MAG: hypothetical protein M1830_002967 [Pleopsidium flavum]
MSHTNTASFPFMKLPPELREKIYHYHLVLPEPVKPTKPSQTTFVLQHMNNCPLSKHTPSSSRDRNEADKTGILKCKDAFTGFERDLLIPESVLAILLVSRQVCSEAIHIFYRFNHFIFTNVECINHFIINVNDRYLDLAELSFAFSSTTAVVVFSKLADCRYLTKLHVKMRFDASYVRLNNGKTLATAAGMKELRKIRGIEVLDLAGRDRLSTASGGWIELDINEEAAIGPKLRQDLMKPRPCRGFNCKH